MDALVAKCEKINAVFEEMYIHKSVLISGNHKEIYHMNNILIEEDYPVEILYEGNFLDTIEKFKEGNIRMLIMTDLMLKALQTHWASILEDVSVYFLSENVNPKHINIDGKIISL